MGYDSERDIGIGMEGRRWADVLRVQSVNKSINIVKVDTLLPVGRKPIWK